MIKEWDYFIFANKSFDIEITTQAIYAGFVLGN